jgi:signal transduction histidine kinase
MGKRLQKNRPGQDARGLQDFAINDLGREVLDIFYRQIVQPDGIQTPDDVCRAFSKVLERFWGLCCLSIFLKGDDQKLHETASEFGEDADPNRLTSLFAELAAEVQSDEREIQVLDSTDKSTFEGSDQKIAEALADAGLKACLAVPIHAGLTLVGALIVASKYPERLSAAISGIRFIASPVVIAVGNVRHSRDMQVQHERIEHLVEELRQHSQALEDANRELRRVAHYRSMFLARMSHELRTPLTSILGFAEILLDHEDLSSTQRRFCEKIQSSGLQLQASLNHLVDLSRLEAGQSELFLHEFSAREALRESCAAVARLAEKRGVSINTDLPDMPSIVSDEGKLRQVLYNFLAHAIGRSDNGEEVKVWCSQSGNGSLGIHIRDMGDAVEDASSLFEAAELRVPDERAATMNELGLVIARRLIDVLGGSVDVENHEPQGVVVTIQLPTRPKG